jgi:hypothetical protein
MSDDLSATAAVVVDPSIGGLQRQSSRGRPGYDRVEAPTFVIDLDDVAGLDAFEAHWTANSSRCAGNAICGVCAVTHPPLTSA